MTIDTNVETFIITFPDVLLVCGKCGMVLVARLNKRKYEVWNGQLWVKVNAGTPVYFYIDLYLISVRLSNKLDGAVLEQLIVTQLVKKSHAFYGNRRFITVFTRTRNWCLSWTSCIQSVPSHTIFL